MLVFCFETQTIKTSASKSNVIRESRNKPFPETEHEYEHIIKHNRNELKTKKQKHTTSKQNKKTNKRVNKKQQP